MRFRHKLLWAVGFIASTVLGLIAINTLVAPDEALVRGTTTGFSTVGDDAPPDEAPPSADSWPEYGYNSQGTRSNPTLSDLGIPGEKRWQANAGSLVEFPPVIDDGIAIVGTNHRRVMAIDVRTGRRKWQYFTKGRIASSPAIANGVAYLTTTDGYLLARRITDGDKLWEKKIGSSSESSPTIVGDALFVATLDAAVLRFDLRGNQIWRVKVPGPVKSAVAVYKDTIIVGDYAGHLSSLAQGDGKRIWSVSSPGRALRGSGRFYAGPSVQYGRVYIGNVNGRFMAFNAQTGKLAWLRSTRDWVYSSAAIANRTVFVGSYDHRLYAFDAASGDVRWTFDAGERISGSPSVIGRTVYVSTLGRTRSSGRTYGVDMVTGRKVWTLPDGRYSPAIAVRSTILIVGREMIYGFTPS
jgi:outer membrane protein assembly factor BamB